MGFSSGPKAIRLAKLTWCHLPLVRTEPWLHNQIDGAVIRMTSQSLLISTLLSLCCQLEGGLISFVPQGD
jgi:hypothetical protein